jgi:tripartite-type tricarboxylate transporter receptor subunit TctC
MLWCWLAAGLSLLICSGGVRADAVADFYRGKSVQVVVGYGTGGGYDVYARLLARYMGKYIPGNPAMVVQNMPGAGSMRAVGYLYSVAPKDGTVFGIFARNVPLVGLLGANSSVQFDPRKFTWLGSSSSYIEDAYLMFVRPDAKVRSIAEALGPGNPEIVLGGTGLGSTGNDVAMLLRDALGLNIKLIAGYPDANALFLAVERGEIEGRITDMSSVRSLRPHWLSAAGGQSSGMNVFLQFARRMRHPDLPDVPTARELAKSDRARALIEVSELSYFLSRPFAGPPGIPPDRAKALQQAFRDVHQDKELLAEAERLKFGVTPIYADEVLPLLDKIAAAPPDVLDYMRKLQAGPTK